MRSDGHRQRLSRRGLRRLGLIAIAAVAATLLASGGATAATRGWAVTTVTNFEAGVPAPSGQVHGAQVVKVDTDGNAINTGSDFITHFGDSYYLYGESYGCGYSFLSVTFCGFGVYRSPDLVHWTSLGKMLDPQNSDFARQTCDTTVTCWGPAVLYDRLTGKYVLWFYRAIGAGTSTPLVVMESDSPTGPWSNPTYPAVPTGFAEDVFVDGDGSAYLSWGGPGSGLHVQRLNAAYTDVTGPVTTVTRPAASPFAPQCLPPGEGPSSPDVQNETPVLLAAWRSCGLTEAPTMLRHGDRYYLLFSNPICAFCLGTETGYFVADSPLGPWSGQNGSPSYDPANPGKFDAYSLSQDSCGGQPFHVANLPAMDGQRVSLYTSVLWENSQNEGAANHYWQPLQFQDGLLAPLTCASTVKVPLAQPVMHQPDPPKALQLCVAGSGNSVVQSFRARETGQIRTIELPLFQRTRPASVFGSEGLVTDPLDVTLTDTRTGEQASTALATTSVPWGPTRVALTLPIDVKAGDLVTLSLNSTSPKGCYGSLYVARGRPGIGTLQGVGDVEQLATPTSALLLSFDEKDRAAR